MGKIHLYQGEIVDSFNINDIENNILKIAGRTLPTKVLFNACSKLEQQLINGDEQLEAILVQGGVSGDEAHEIVVGLSDVFSLRYLEDKLVHELGSIDPFVLRRSNMEQNVLEGYQPLGVLCHVAAGNSPGLGALSVLEGAMSGNINIVKLSSKENGFSAMLLYKLVQSDSTNTLRDYIYALDISSSEKDILSRIFDFSTSVVAWGGTDALDSIKSMTATPIIAWGHHISFGYLTKAGATKTNMLGIAKDICMENQQACSSPQCIFYEGDYADLKSVATMLYESLAEVSPTIPLASMSINEQAQITSSNLMVTLGSCMDESELMEAEDGSFRIYISNKSSLEPSPLYRTIWLKPIKRSELPRILFPMSRFLQTVSLGCQLNELYELTSLFTGSGVTRVVECGSVFFSFPGEPHDGTYALVRYCKRVSVITSLMDKIASIEQLKPYEPVSLAETEIMDKNAFMETPVSDALCKLYVKSGGSSGKTIMSPYSYRDYHFQMRSAAESLIGIGLKPQTDRVLNLFSGGDLYGGFLSFSAILEFANAKHYPMGENLNTRRAAEIIVELGINVLMGMPSYILKLFRENKALLAEYGSVEKIYYGGEFLSLADKDMLCKDYGVKVFSSMFYGSNDVGPMGYACSCCSGGVHHLLTAVIDMEIVKIESDEPVVGGETGRLLFSPKYRQSHSVARYEVGDLGRWVDGDCECGRKDPRFELMGRFGDIFRVGGYFFNYGIISTILNTYAQPTQLQLVLKEGVPEIVELRVGHDFKLSTIETKEILTAHYADFKEALNNNYMQITIVPMEENQMDYAPNSGKLKRVIESRTKKSPQ